MNRNDSTPIASETIAFHGLTLVVDVASYTPARPAPPAQTPDCPGYDDEGDAEEIEYEAKYPIIECAETFMESLNLEENDEFRAMIIEKMRNQS
jgi:hypothetical protein